MTWKNYGHATPSQLATRTHAPGTPWHQTLPNEVIDRELIAPHFLDLYEKLRVG